MINLLFYSEVDRRDWWHEEFAKHRDDVRLVSLADLDEGRTAPDEIDYALLWKPPHGLTARLPRLKAIFSLGAGIDHLLADPKLRRDVPMTRVVDANLTGRMTEYVALHVLRHHRRQTDYEALQRLGKWRLLAQPPATERRVGILGMGVLGGDAARVLGALGFALAGWTRTPRAAPGIEVFHGAEGLGPFLARTEILVCLLPLTPETEGIIDAGFLARLPRGASLINAARGGHVVEPDLLAALDSGHISWATLDVFRTEPLPSDSPFWHHPKVTVTPHAAAVTDPRACVAQVAENIGRIERGEAPLNQVDLSRGY
jgi:glyoxylate/hydroxypyruvate reductase A